MDVSDITKAASRKRMSEDAEKLRDKISRETAKIIKLKVAQDTAYWDLKEKLQQVESNHERLQQNMVEVQMQHETISGKYQDELRLRPEILNKVCGTRSICDVLEEYGARLRATVERAHTDRLTLAASNRAAAGRVQRLRETAERALLQQQHHAAALHDKMRTAGERYAAMSREAEATRKAAEAQAHEAHARLEAEAARRERAQADADRLTSQLRRTSADLDRKDRLISEMQRETQRVVSELETRIDALEHTVTQQRTELESRATEMEHVSERAATAEEDARQLHAQVQTLRDTLTETEACVERLNRTVATLSENNEQLTSEIREKEQVLQQNDDVVQELEGKLSALEVVKGSLASQVSAAEEARAASDAERERVCEQLQQLQRTEQQLRDEFTQYRCESERDACDKETQLTAAGDTIARLMRDVQTEADARHRLELAAKSKDDELATRHALLTDIRDENERLRATIASMQATIDNIQKELTTRVGAACDAINAERRQRPERLRADPPPRPPHPPHPAHPPPPSLDHMLYNFLSDASEDADTHDSPLSLSQVKRNLNAKSRAYFKSKKCEAKYKKHK